MLKIRYIPVLFLLPLSQLFGQYWGEQILEKSFEKSDFFYHPQQINPYGIQGFGEAMIGVLDDPLLNMQINPAILASDSLTQHTIYTDFRNDREIKSRPGYYYPMRYDYYALSSSYIPYSAYYGESHKDQEPVFSGAWLYRPWTHPSNITFGLTYQMMSQDEDYYSIPQDIYLSNVGWDYAGNRVMDESSSISITDVYSGQDDMHQEAHFLSFLMAGKVSPGLDIGARISRVTYIREGGYGNQYDRNTYYYSDTQSLNWTNRDQDYNHWDISAGLQAHFHSSSNAGISFGVLKGEVDQNLTYESNYVSEYNDNDDYWSHYYSDSDKSQTWNHDGQTFYGKGHLSFQMDLKTRLRIYYGYMKEDIDLQNSSAIFDTSFSEYQHDNVDYSYHSRYISSLRDQRYGNGTRDASRHYFTLALNMHPDRKSKIYLGAHIESHDVTTRTIEYVNARNFNDSYWENSCDGIQTRYYKLNEHKYLHWDLNIETVKIQIPVLFTRTLNETFELFFGLNRTYNRWTITEKTLAIFDDRIKIVDSTEDYKTDFGERYTQPEKNQSDVSTAFLAGLNIHPSDIFEIRMMMVPEYAKTSEGNELNTFQWWIAFGLHY